MNTLIARLALEWASAERSARARDVIAIADDATMVGRVDDAKTIMGQAAQQPPPSSEELAIASDHVHRVLAGEVRWSEATPGDKAIWKLRFRDVEKFLRWQRRDENIELPADDELVAPQPPVSPIPEIPRTANVLAGTMPPPPLGYRQVRTGPQLQGYRERLWWNYYDTLTIDETAQGRSMMFGVANIGNFWRTNMLQAGVFPGDQTFVIDGYWATISDMGALGWFADNLQAQIILNNRPMTPLTFGRDLFMGVPLMPPYGRPIIVPVRMGFMVEVNIKLPLPKGVKFDMTFHLDGLGTRDVQ